MYYMTMIALATYPIETVHSAMDLAIAESKRAILPDGRTFKPGSHRLVLFKNKGIACSKCGIEGSIYILETHNAEIAPHLNLYAFNEKGKRILMTKDHTLPKSKGGANELENYTTMCSPCNSKKGSNLE